MVLVDVELEYRRHVAELAHYATVLVGPDDAMDVVNEAVAATLARSSLVGVDDVRAYWFRAVTNTAAGWHRSNYRRRTRETRVSTDAYRVVREATTMADDAQEVLSSLSVQQRAVVYLTYWHDWEPARVAATLGVSEGTIRQQLGRGREKLREVLRRD